MNSYFLALRKCTDFDTRTNRTDFWMFTLFNTFFMILTTIMDSFLNLPLPFYIGPFRILYSLFIFLPSLAITVRRLHDTDKSGWNILVSIVPVIGTFYLFFLLATKGDEEDNSYLPDTNPQDGIKLYDNIALRDTIVILLLSYMFLGNITWYIIGKVVQNFFTSIWYKVFASADFLVWAFFPIILSLFIKSETKRIAGLIIGSLFCLFTFYRIIELLRLTLPSYVN